jgi:hypothetical protein
LISLYGWLGLSHAAEWSLKGFLDQSLGYDDNVFMSSSGTSNNTQGKQGSFQYKITPVLSFLHKTDVSELEANASYGTQVYTDVEGLDFDVQNYSLRGLYNTELIDWGLSANYSVIPTRNNAIANSGIFSTNTESTTKSISPTITFKIDEINSLNLSSTYAETTFGNTTSTDQGLNNFRNNTNANVNIAWQRLWSERYTTALSWFYNTVDYGQQQNPGANQNTSNSFDSTGLNFSNTYLWSPNWKFNGTIGFRHTNSESGNPPINHSSDGFLADVGVDYTGESYSTGVHFSRSLVPSTFGQLQEQTSIGLDFSYKITERLSAGLNTSYQESTFVNGNASQPGGNGNGSQTRKNIFINPSVRWQLAPDWSLTGSYRYRSQTGFLQADSNNRLIDQTADSNLFLLSINYTWQGMKMSR